jgi:class 3 adenylate cyclase
MSYYSYYTDIIQEKLRNTRDIKKSNIVNHFSGDPQAQRNSVLETRQFGLKQDSALNGITSTFNLPGIKPGKLGEHPDFIHLKNTDNTEYHYITSVFIDIKGSTNLFKKYELEEIYTITNTILSAAIHTCIVLGGYIQRLQGDGVLVYFGGKGIEKRVAVKAALTATSLFTYFVKYDIKKMFEQAGIENINTRIGIDFGEDDKVMWANFGIGECSELTTISLHTSLSSKMQAKAKANGIVLGQNVKQYLAIDDDFFENVTDSNGNIDRYIYEDREAGLNYCQFDFKWHKYLKSLPNIKELNGEELLIEDTSQNNDKQLNRLMETANLINTGGAFTNRSGMISTNDSGTKNLDHRFHYDS